MIDYRSLTRKELEDLAGNMGLPAYRGRQVFKWLWRPGLSGFHEITDLPSGLRNVFAQKGRIARLKVATEQKSVDGTIKLGLGLDDGLMIECVVIPEKDHLTLCLSTQVGCAMGCSFCYTARMGFLRNLEASEIAGQVIAVMERLGLEERPRNLVFMGMGEPLANYENLTRTVQILTDELGLNYSGRRITVSTSGLAPEMLRLGQDLDVGLAISLHAPDDEIRQEIMPINRRYPISALINACKSYPIKPRRRITFEYLLLQGINDRMEQARGLARLLRGIPAKINLIPFNESPGLSFKAPSEEDVLAFQKVLTDAGYTAIIRKSKGQDIAAACGQLNTMPLLHTRGRCINTNTA
ncbi:23S rRNA (adenine(2503)-C(2))-methyltransferase RlmN [Dissulfurimicrobium hydrothermale]|uniref:23S rRNA (adenine(2503)-C(2))-methyltransferase RlmN n=1 Tax=Dissulfurimicrobium hydrothermale TaxID=1750598 RepID=UPI001ED9D83E|nr:23S rRNA (adenine(2503)-C(2))-methyltransferase RlmN [Dissulfurimicrobium hydrothermale]UKL14261.1 23S rRNA (adenine(2503)-C(2))-methyltransferase RlmN [Dissulfurimicrobium hydrothermale]